LARFTLDEAQVEVLTSRDIPIGQRFFDAMDKTERIREDCRVFMAGEDGSTKAYIYPSSFFEGWKLWFLLRRIWNKAMRNSFDTVQISDRTGFST